VINPFIPYYSHVPKGLKNRRLVLLLVSSLIAPLISLGASISTAPQAFAAAGQSSECVIGSAETCPATSPQEIYNLYGTTAGGTYWMKVAGVSTQVHLYMNPSDSAGGGWILLMKGKKGTTDFYYDSATFTSNSSTLNTDSLSNDVSTDAKFGVYNTLAVSKLLAVLKDPAAGTIVNSGDIDNNGFGGHTWVETLASPTTAFTQISSTTYIQKNPVADVRDGSYLNIPTTKYLTSSGAINLSYQPGNGRYGFSGSPCMADGMKFRWGVAWNQEGDFGSCDVVVGIGISTGARTDIQGDSSSSPGDHVRWTGAYETASVNRGVMAGAGHGNTGFQIWGKVADPSLGAPSVATPTTPASEQVNLSWSAPAATTPVDYVVQYKTNVATSYSNSFVVTGQTTAQITGLTGGTAYNFRVIARTASNSTSSANFAAATVSTTPYKSLSTPSAPTVAATSNTLKSLDVSWPAVTDAVSYSLKLYTSAGVLIPTTGLTGLAGTSKTISTSNYAAIADSTTYKVSITAIGNGTTILDSSESALSSGASTNALPGSPAITAQPTNQSSASSATATFTVTATSPDSGVLAYQWQVSTNSGGSWSNVSSGSGGTTSSFTTASLIRANNGNQYRVVVTNAKNGATSAALNSSAATLTVAKSDQVALTNPVLSFTSAPYSGTAYTRTLTVTSVGGGSGEGELSITGVANGDATGCSFSAGTLTATSRGTCIITVTKAEDADYNSASTTATFEFTKASQSPLTITSVGGFYKTPLTFVTSGGSGSGNLSFTLNSGNCTVVGGTIVGNQVGATCAVTATNMGDDNYQPISSSSTNILIARGVLTSNLFFQPSITRATYQVISPLVATASQLSKVTFLANGKSIPGCINVLTVSGVSPAPLAALCRYRPATLGSVTITATAVPLDSGFQGITKSTKVTVSLR